MNLASWIKLLRPHHWTKNGFCAAGYLFGTRVGEWALLPQVLGLFSVFCMASSAGYIFNDLLDEKLDHVHPRKRNRPLAAGEVSRTGAAVLSSLLAVTALVLGYYYFQAAFYCLAGYMLCSVLYSLFVKRVIVLDVIVIALGFVFRLLAGVYLIQVVPTAWIVLCTLFIALFLGFCKRRAEMEALPGFSAQRPVLEGYTIPFLDSMVSNCGMMAVICYALFAINPAKNSTLVLTVPIVFFCIMHYEHFIATTGRGEEPEKALLHDRPLQAGILVWLAVYFAITQSGIELFK